MRQCSLVQCVYSRCPQEEEALDCQVPHPGGSARSTQHDCFPSRTMQAQLGRTLGSQRLQARRSCARPACSARRPVVACRAMARQSERQDWRTGWREQLGSSSSSESSTPTPAASTPASWRSSLGVPSSSSAVPHATDEAKIALLNQVECFIFDCDGRKEGAARVFAWECAWGPRRRTVVGRGR